MKAIEQLRNEYVGTPLEPDQMASDPVEQFRRWLQEALDAEIQEPHAMTLSTVDSLGQPSARIVLLRGLQDGSLVFYTNYTSRKAVELSSNPQACLLFFWQPLFRQVRIEGRVTFVDQVTSDTYFAGRPRGSQVGAWASPQSAPIPDRVSLVKNFERFQRRFASDPEVPRPSFWGGYTLKPHKIEFWQGRQNRLHDRILYQRSGDQWKVERLAP